jgi:hypothetical protein
MLNGAERSKLYSMCMTLSLVAVISRRNSMEALLRHDWVCRWNEMGRIIGIGLSLRMAECQPRLKGVADFIFGECRGIHRGPGAIVLVGNYNR